MTDPRQLVARTADAVGDHATASALLVDVQVVPGWLAQLSPDATERGRRAGRRLGRSSLESPTPC